MLTRRNWLGAICGAVAAWFAPKASSAEEEFTFTQHWEGVIRPSWIEEECRKGFTEEWCKTHIGPQTHSYWHRNPDGTLVPFDVERPLWQPIL